MGNKRNLKLGTTVTWSSQAGGHTVKKTGKVVCVVAVGVNPFRIQSPNLEGKKCWALPNGLKIPCSRTRYGGGLSREEESYIVRVEGPKPNTVESYYWPQAKLLQVENEQG